MPDGFYNSNEKKGVQMLLNIIIILSLLFVFFLVLLLVGCKIFKSASDAIDADMQKFREENKKNSKLIRIGKD